MAKTSLPAHQFAVSAGGQEVKGEAAQPLPKNLAGFLEAARGGGESPWEITLTILPACVWHILHEACVCAVFAPCWRLEADRQSCPLSWQLTEVVPSVWHSAALWGLIAAKSSGTSLSSKPGTPPSSPLRKNEMVKGPFWFPSSTKNKSLCICYMLSIMYILSKLSCNLDRSVSCVLLKLQWLQATSNPHLH